MIYILHFNDPAGKMHHARHYTGYVTFPEHLPTRLKEHDMGRGARLMQVVAEREVDWMLARVMPGDKNRERQLKNSRNIPDYCPVCQGRLPFTSWTQQKKGYVSELIENLKS